MKFNHNNAVKTVSKICNIQIVGLCIQHINEKKQVTEFVLCINDFVLELHLGKKYSLECTRCHSLFD